MDKPKQPHRDLIDLYHCGYIWSIEYDKELSEESRAEAESESHGGYYEWQAMIQIKGRVPSNKLCHPDETCTTICEDIFNLYVTQQIDNNQWGFWQVTEDGKKLVEDRELLLRREAKDLKEWKRLQAKFAGVK